MYTPVVGAYCGVFLFQNWGFNESYHLISSVLKQLSNQSVMARPIVFNQNDARIWPHHSQAEEFSCGHYALSSLHFAWRINCHRHNPTVVSISLAFLAYLQPSFEKASCLRVLSEYKWRTVSWVVDSWWQIFANNSPMPSKMVGIFSAYELNRQHSSLPLFSQLLNVYLSQRIRYNFFKAATRSPTYLYS